MLNFTSLTRCRVQRGSFPLIAPVLIVSVAFLGDHIPFIGDDANVVWKPALIFTTDRYIPDE